MFHYTVWFAPLTIVIKYIQFLGIKNWKPNSSTAAVTLENNSVAQFLKIRPLCLTATIISADRSFWLRWRFSSRVNLSLTLEIRGNSTILYYLEVYRFNFEGKFRRKAPPGPRWSVFRHELTAARRSAQCHGVISWKSRLGLSDEAKEKTFILVR